MPISLPVSDPSAAVPAPPRAWSYSVTYDTYSPPEEGEEHDGEPSDSGFEVEDTPITPDETDREEQLDTWQAHLGHRRAAWWDSAPGEAGPFPAGSDVPPAELLDSAAAVAAAVGILQDRGCTEDGGGGESWYSADSEQDYRTGESTTYVVHLQGFTAAELAAIRTNVKGVRYPLRHGATAAAWAILSAGGVQ